MKVSELRSMTREELEHERTELREEEFRLRIRRPTEELSNALRLRSIRRDIARINTILREDKLGVIALPRKSTMESKETEKEETTKKTQEKSAAKKSGSTKKISSKSSTGKKGSAKTGAAKAGSKGTKGKAR